MSDISQFVSEYANTNNNLSNVSAGALSDPGSSIYDGRQQLLLGAGANFTRHRAVSPDPSISSTISQFSTSSAGSHKKKNRHKPFSRPSSRHHDPNLSKYDNNSEHFRKMRTNPSSWSLGSRSLDGNSICSDSHNSHNSHNSQNGSLLSYQKQVTSNNGPLPPGWTMKQTVDGTPYFINEVEKTTTWVDPRTGNPVRGTQYQNGLPISEHQHPEEQQPLPAGWEMGYAPNGHKYFINHKEKKTYWTDPRKAPPMKVEDRHVNLQREQALLRLKQLKLAREELKLQEELMRVQQEELESQLETSPNHARMCKEAELETQRLVAMQEKTAAQQAEVQQYLSPHSQKPLIGMLMLDEFESKLNNSLNPPQYPVQRCDSGYGMSIDPKTLDDLVQSSSKVSMQNLPAEPNIQMLPTDFGADQGSMTREHGGIGTINLDVLIDNAETPQDLSPTSIAEFIGSWC